MSLHSDKFDPQPILDELHEDLFSYVGKPIMRMAGPELQWFLDDSVRRALVKAFSQAETLYIKDIVKQADQSSKTLMEGIMAGAKLAEWKENRE